VTSQVRINQVLKPYNQFLHQFGAIDPPSCNPCTKKLRNFCIHQTHFNLGFVVFGQKQVEREREIVFVVVAFHDILLAIPGPLCSRSLKVDIATKACITKS